MIDPMIEKVINLFTPDEWRAVIWLLVCTVAATHTLKIVWRFVPIKGGGNGQVQVIAIVAGFASAFLMWPEHTVPWYAAGVIAGPASSVAFKIAFGVLTKYFPTIAAAVNADRRKLELGPPPATDERRKDEKP